MTIYTQIDANKRKTRLIMALFIIFISLIGYIFGRIYGSGLSGFGVALIISGVMSFFSYYYSDKVVLLLSSAKQIHEKDNPHFFHTVENLCIGSGLPMPKIYIIEDTAPNAFATGRDPEHAVLVATTGLLQKLEKLELEGVVAHELSHIKNYDIRLMSIVVILVGVISLLADWFIRSFWWSGGRRRERRGRGGNIGFILLAVGIVLAILSPVIATLLKLAISRNREYLADASAALLTRYPDGLASALEKIATDKEPLEAANAGTAHLYIVNPLKSDIMHNLFSTHPPVGERIQRLRAM